MTRTNDAGATTEETAIIALGSNLPWRGQEPSAILDAAVSKLGGFGRVVARSGWWRTQAWPDPSDPEFLNLCVRIETAVAPVELMAELLALEAAFGRERNQSNAPRTLDLDIIDYAGRVIDAPVAGGRPALALPHPRLHERAFVLLPLQDVAPAWRHPVSGVSVGELVAQLTPEARATAQRVAL